MFTDGVPEDDLASPDRDWHEINVMIQSVGLCAESSAKVLP